MPGTNFFPKVTLTPLFTLHLSVFFLYALLFVLVVFLRVEPHLSRMPSPKPVILDHDGGHDDLVALALLLGNPEKVKVIGCIVTDADCFVEHGFEASGKLMSLMHAEEGTALFPIAMSNFKGLNPFPSDWRWSARNIADLPSLNIPEHVAAWKALEPDNRKYVGEQLLADLVMASPEKVTICVTGPLSSVAWCIDRYGDKFCKNVDQCIIMGGAVDVRGNVFLDRTDGTAEWNIFWDPVSAKKVLTNPSMSNILFSLDSTNHVPVNSTLAQRFGAQNHYVLSQFVGSAWSSCTHVELQRPGDGYYAWDVLTAAYAVDPTIAEVEPIPLDVVVDQVPSEGRIIRSPSSTVSTLVAKNTDAEKFYALVLRSAEKCLVRIP